MLSTNRANGTVIVAIPGLDFNVQPRAIVEVKHYQLNEKFVDGLRKTKVAIVGPLTESLTLDEVRALNKLSEKARVIFYGLDAANKNELQALSSWKKALFVKDKETALRLANGLIGRSLNLVAV